MKYEVEHIHVEDTDKLELMPKLNQYIEERTKYSEIKLLSVQFLRENCRNHTEGGFIWSKEYLLTWQLN